MITDIDKPIPLEGWRMSCTVNGKTISKLYIGCTREEAFEKFIESLQLSGF